MQLEARSLICIVHGIAAHPSTQQLLMRSHAMPHHSDTHATLVLGTRAVTELQNFIRSYPAAGHRCVACQGHPSQP